MTDSNKSGPLFLVRSLPCRDPRTNWHRQDGYERSGIFIFMVHKGKVLLSDSRHKQPCRAWVTSASTRPHRPSDPFAFERRTAVGATYAFSRSPLSRASRAFMDPI
jgi:hypothetical protein